MKYKYYTGDLNGLIYRVSREVLKNAVSDDAQLRTEFARTNGGSEWGMCNYSKEELRRTFSPISAQAAEFLAREGYNREYFTCQEYCN